MSRIRKSSLFGLTAAVIVASAALASPAAANYYVYPTLHNANTSHDVTTGSVTWSGSYVQIPSPVTAGSTKSGTYHTVLTYGSGYVQFNAYPIPGDTTNYCLMTFSISNATGAISAQFAIPKGDPALVSCSKSGTNNTDFTASAPGY